MAYKVFVDTNIILDIFLKREPFFDDSQKVLLEISENDFIPHITGSSVTDLYYICKKSGMEKGVILENLKELLKAFEVLIIDKDSIIDAISSDIKDFEDAVQIMACKEGKIDWVQVQTPQEFLASTSKEQLHDSFESKEEI